MSLVFVFWAALTYLQKPNCHGPSFRRLQEYWALEISFCLLVWEFTNKSSFHFVFTISFSSIFILILAWCVASFANQYLATFQNTPDCWCNHTLLRSKQVFSSAGTRISAVCWLGWAGQSVDNVPPTLVLSIRNHPCTIVFAGACWVWQYQGWWAIQKDSLKRQIKEVSARLQVHTLQAGDEGVCGVVCGELQQRQCPWCEVLKWIINNCQYTWAVYLLVAVHNCPFGEGYNLR